MGTFRGLFLTIIALSLANDARALAAVASFGFRVPNQWRTGDPGTFSGTGLRMGTQPSGGDSHDTPRKKRKNETCAAAVGAKTSGGCKVLAPPSIAPDAAPSQAAPSADTPGRNNSGNGGSGQRLNNKGGGGRRKVDKSEKKDPRLRKNAAKGKKKKRSNKSRNRFREDNDNQRSSSSTSGTTTIPPFTLASNKGSTPLPSNALLDILASSMNSTEPLFQNTTSSLPDNDDVTFGDAVSAPVIEGTLPVGELFYRSTQSLHSSASGDMGKGMAGEGGTEDDEELPFSAEQSNRLSTTGQNKIRVRRNNAVTDGGGDGSTVILRDNSKSKGEEDRQFAVRFKEKPLSSHVIKQQSKAIKRRNKSGRSDSRSNHDSATAAPAPARPRSRKMVRRGMEVLVGGEPVNADPPQRFSELHYHDKLAPHQLFQSVTTSSPDFGPLLHQRSAAKVTLMEQGLFCERFLGVTKKWGIAPPDLGKKLAEHKARQRTKDAAIEWLKRKKSSPASISDDDMDTLMDKMTPPSENDANTDLDEDGRSHVQTVANSRVLGAPKGFGSQKKQPQRKKKTGNKSDTSSFTLCGEFKFSLAICRSDLESSLAVFRRVLTNGIREAIDAKKMGFYVRISKLVLVTSDEGEGEFSTDVSVFFELEPQKPVTDIAQFIQTEQAVNMALANAMDDGRMAVACARSAREEEGWSEEMRNRIVEEFLFDEEDEDNSLDKEEEGGFGESGGREQNNDDSKCYEKKNSNEQYDGPFGTKGDVIYARDDIWLGGGNGGVFFDYSESNVMNSPYKGRLGPFLVEAAIERARQNQPRVIAIGDVHGCIDELKALLKKCDFHPGDLCLFLGDLVCKGPDSQSVVQLAREIGAIGVRGNHDFEVVRWHQAIKSGADPPLIGSEHYYVASALSTADLRWLYSLPWFVSSEQLNALFVHAGFVSGIRLAKQNPRLMMNMRSILPDGTVTSKFFNNWPWARLWDGPQTVFFGHDADRGLQEYEHGIGLDTGCVYGGKLTACILPERRIVSVNAKREYFHYRRKHFD